MLNISPHIISKLYAVARCYRRVCCIIVNSAYTACCKYGVLCGIITVLSFVKHIKQEIVASLGKTEQVSVFKNRDIGQLLYALDKRSNYLKAGAVLVVSDSVTAVTALKGKVD